MPVAIVDPKVAGGVAVGASLSVDFDNQPQAGLPWVAAAGCFFQDTNPDLTIPAPGGLPGTPLEDLRIGGNLGVLLNSKTSSGSDGTTSTAAKSGTQRALAVAAFTVTGSSGIGTTGASDGGGNSISSILVETNANVPADNSVAVMMLFKQSIAGGSTITWPSGWQEIGKAVTTTSGRCEVYMAKKSVNSGAKAGGTASFTGTPGRIRGVIVTFSPSAQPVIVTVPTAQEMVRRAGNTIPGLDIQASSDVTVTLGASHGTFTAPNAGAAGVTVDSGSGTGTLVLSGTVSAMNTLFAQTAPNGVVYRNDGYTADEITVDAVDQTPTAATQQTIGVTMVTAKVLANSQVDLNATLTSMDWQHTVPGAYPLVIIARGTGVSPSPEVTTLITLTDLGLPVVTVPGAKTVESGVQLPLPTISIVDPLNDVVSCRLRTTIGLLTVTLNGAAQIASGQNSSSDLTITGTHTEILNTVGTLVYVSAPGFSGTDQVVVTVTDALNNTDEKSFSVTVTVAIPPPVNVVPGAQSFFVQIPTAIGGISVTDPNGQLTSVQLTAVHALLHVDLSGGATISAGSNDSLTLTLTGTQVAINDALATLIYTSHDFLGSDIVTVRSVNQGGKQAISQILVTILTIPVLALPAVQIPNPILAITEIPIPIPAIVVHDNDGDLVWVRLTVVNGILHVSLPPGVTIAEGANDSVTMRLDGTESAIAQALVSLLYTSNPGFIGVETLSIVAQDVLGLSSSENLSIIVNPVPGSEPISNSVQTLLRGLRENLGRVYGESL